MIILRLVAIALLVLISPADGRAHPKSEALTKTGKALLEAGAFDRAIGYFEKALEDWPDNKAARDELKAALQKQRTAEKDRALQLARLYRDQGWLDQAREQYLAALKAHPTDVTDQKVKAKAEAEFAEFREVVTPRPKASLRAQLGTWIEWVGEHGPWALLAIVVILVLEGNIWNFIRHRICGRRAVEVRPFEGPDGNFKQATGAGMAALASSQLSSAGISLGIGGTPEPLTELSAKLSDPRAKMLAEAIALFLPPYGFRLEAVVHTFDGKTGVTAKLIRLGFVSPRERVIATETFWNPPGVSSYGNLARLTAAWTEWNVLQ